MTDTVTTHYHWCKECGHGQVNDPTCSRCGRVIPIQGVWESLVAEDATTS